MKKLFPLFLSASLTLAAESVKPLPIGTAAPGFNLPGIDGMQHTLADYSKADVLVVAFLSNHCPDSQASEGRVKKLVEDMKGKSFALVAINPNNPLGLRPDELGYSKYNDSFDEMKLHAKEQGFNFPYLYDGETQSTAHAYGCLATPHVFIFDKERKLRYQGRFDESRFADDSSVRSPDARNAVEALLAGKEVAVTETKVHGCSTKWISKQDAVAKDDERWEKGAVEVELIDAKGVAALRKNDTDKVRMFNVWATWCGPCVKEFPELVKTSRKFGLRNFEFISISLDDPKTIAEVKAFLEKKHAIVPDKLKPSLAKEGRKGNAYVFSEANNEPLIAALDPGWEGAIPFTLVVAPGGKVVFHHAGQVDGDELRAKILDHMGRFYTPETAPKEKK
ncbi:MAG: redoxin domain-containing protein [Verrucomicrobiaceae bacterium]|nr:redoxin domain-containing protein [Verrucomicrobiaceae bacterium]